MLHFRTLKKQQDDLAESIELLHSTIEKINQTTQQRFLDTFELVSENFKEIFDWMDAIVPVSDPTKYSAFVASQKTATGEQSAIDNDMNQYSDITLVTNTNKNIPNRYFRFHDAFPISLSGIEMESGADGETVIATVSFRFTYYEIQTTS